MISRLAVLLFLLGISLLEGSCGGKKVQEKATESVVKEHFEHANKLIVQRERKDIEDFIRRHHFSMDSTGTGLRYSVYRKGQGAYPHPHDRIVFSYRVFFLTGDLIYEINDASPDTANLAEGMLVNGLEEAVAGMNQGAKAHIILPAHLAYGMLGDEKKIPGATPLFYDLHLIKINP
jgi:FKBP-type peptidyl-prolyl cis-trans isomerase FkpA